MSDIWSSRDALVVKVLAQVLQDRLKTVLSKACYHLKGNGAAKGAVRAVAGRYRNYTLIGRKCRGFDFLGYHFGPYGISLEEKTVVNFVNKPLRFYEQEPLHRRMMQLGEYTIRWRGRALGWPGELNHRGMH